MAKTLLLADDSVTIQRVVDLTFAHEDIRVVAVPDGSRAIKWLETERPDIVLVDVDLPEVDGYGIVTHLKQSKKLGGVPVLLLAGAFEPVDQERARAIGCDGIIVKPFEPQQLVARVKELLAVAGGLGRSAGSREPAGRAPLYTGRPIPRRCDLRAARVAVGARDESRSSIRCVRAEPRDRPSSGRAAEPWRPPDRLELPTRPAWEHERPRHGARSRRQGLAGERVLGPARCGAVHSARASLHRLRCRDSPTPRSKTPSAASSSR